MGALKGGGTIGYKYLMSVHMGLGRMVNSINEIRVGDLTAWTGNCCYNGDGMIQIEAANLFGGDDKEGGVQGPAKVYFGAPDQELSGPIGSLPGIAASLGGDVPNFRGVTTVWFDGEVCSINPYPKEWAFRVQRSTAGWADENCWYPAKATIYMSGPKIIDYDTAMAAGGDTLAVFEANGGTKAQTAILPQAGNISAMNGAHILYECATDPDWGRGLDRVMFDDNSYTLAANQLCSEGFGLCIPWFRQETVKEFTQVVIDHIGATQYVDRETGLMTLKLIRGDYDPDALPLFTLNSGLLAIDEDDASSQEQAYNEIIVKGFDPINKAEFSVRVQNLASIQSLGVIISNTIEYKGIPTRDLASRVAMRELKAQTNVRRLTVRLDRRAWRIAPGAVFRISHPGRGIGNMILRAGEITEADSTTGEIQIKAVQDVFGMPDTTYVEVQPPGWSPPDLSPHAPDNERLVELSYRDVYRMIDPANRDALDRSAAFIGDLVERPTPSATGYDLATRLGADPYVVLASNQDFTGTAIIAADLAPLDDLLTIDPADAGSFLMEYTDGMAALLGDEVIKLSAYDAGANTFAILRGTTDTIPAPHVAGDRLWLLDDDIGTDGKEYASGETVDALALTRTSTGLLNQDDATPQTIDLAGRFGRPYPPGNVQVGGTTIYTSGGEQPEPVLTWNHRDRIAEADVLVGHGEGSVGPEPGTTYTVRVYDLDDVLLRETTGIALETWTYDVTMQAADGSPNIVRFELESSRDDLTSLFLYTFMVTLSGGYGLGYGLNYGGA